ncbi:MAG: flagellar basal body protein [Proteobacteria bacterium]|nr:flagellar basal body protein [Pseudomonadota bacterium]
MLQDVTLCLLQRMLDVDELKQQVISNNIANTNIPGFQPQRVSFDKSLAAIAASLQSGSSTDEPLNMINHSGIDIEEATTQTSLDQQMLLMNQTSVEYQSLAKAAQQKYSLLSIAINGSNQ